MADEKKKGPDASALFHKDHYKEVIYMLIPGLIVIGLIAQRLMLLLRSIEYTVLYTIWLKIVHFFLAFWSFWRVASVVLIGWGIYTFIYSHKKIREIDHEEEKIYGRKIDEAGENAVAHVVDKSEEKWLKIVAHANSENPSEWRVAIIEADIMLEELLRASGYHGESIGDMLKSVEVGDMVTLDAAWEAHKVRNRIAHSGTDFDLTDRETRRVISLFEAVFKEFEII